MLCSILVMFPFHSFPSLFDRWLDSNFSSFKYSVRARVFLPRDVDPILPGVEVFHCVFPFLGVLKCFRVSMGDILSALCDIKMYHTPI